MKKRMLTTSVTALAVIASALTAALTASAANMSNGTNGVLTSSDTELIFTKDLVIHNEDTSVTSVYGPTITYNYDIAAADGESLATVKDSTGKSMQVSAGIPAAVTFTDNKAEFASAAVTLTDGKYIASDDLKLTFDTTKFPSAGIYRYKITESVADADLEAAAITRDSDNYSADRYLDVYVKNGTDGLEVSSYVMFHKGSSEDFAIDGTDTATTEKKTDGYDSEDKNGSEGDTGNMADHYYTFNHKIKKQIEGDLADMTHKFPFTVSVASADKTGQTYSVECPDTAITTGTIGTGFTVSLGNDDTITLTGLPADAQISVSETNDTPNTYQAAVVNPTVAAAAVAADGTCSFADEKLTDYTAALNAAPTKALTDDTVFTNTLESISPTGVILTVAPYAIMLGAAFFFIFIYMKNKKREGSESAV